MEIIIIIIGLKSFNLPFIMYRHVHLQTRILLSRFKLYYTPLIVYFEMMAKTYSAPSAQLFAVTLQNGKENS
jgi:hypothetical protein